MKKLIVLLLVIFITLPVFSNDIYLELNAMIKNEENVDSIVAAYNAKKADMPLVYRGRIESSIGGVYIGLDQEAKAIEYLDIASATQASIKPSTVESEVLFAQIGLKHYEIDGSLSKGLKSSNLIKNLYKKNKDLPLLKIAEATRLFTLPGIAGGSVKKSLAIYVDSLKIADEFPLDVRFELYAGISEVYQSKKDKKNALKYALLAKEIYPNNSEINQRISDCK